MQWVPESNGSQTSESGSAASDFKATWRCGEGCERCGMLHEWSGTVIHWTQLRNGCPFCSGHKPCRCCSPAAIHPELMKQWDWEGHQGTDPYGIACFSERKVSWICTQHAPWDATPAQRVYFGQGCPECARRRDLGHCGYMKDEFPDVYAELHPTKNGGVDINKLMCGSTQRV